LEALADAAVVVLTDRAAGVRRLLEILRAVGKPVHLIGAVGVARVSHSPPLNAPTYTSRQ
jgi:hypothetical protein